MKEIKLTQGKVAFVDDEDYERVNQYKWCISTSKRSKTEYAIRRYTEDNKNKYQYMHRFILNVDSKLINIDHKDNNGTNNQKYNIRLSTQQQNCFNTLPRLNNTSKYKGVRIHGSNKDMFCASITLNNVEHYLGGYDKEEQAAMVYDAIARYYMKDFAYTNFKEEYIKPLSVESLKEKLKLTEKTIKAINIITNEIFIGTVKEVTTKYNTSKVTLYKKIRTGKLLNNIKFSKISYKLKINKEYVPN